MRKIISLFCFLLPVLAFAAQAEEADSQGRIRGDAPDRHVVVKGDTLWDISGMFFKDPWKWPHIWGLNKDTVKNPHWIYPGDIIYLDRNSGTLRIGEEASGSIHSDSGVVPGTAVASETGHTAAPFVPNAGNNAVRLSPRVRESPSINDTILSIPAKIIAPFLKKPLVIEEDALENAPTLIGAREGRVILGTGDIGFIKGLPSDKGDKWQFYRPGKTFTDPETDEVLGIEAVYLGNAEVSKQADVSTVAITASLLEIYPGDRLVEPYAEEIGTYLPRAPEKQISARVISVYGGVAQGGQNSVITLSKGARDGLEIGHVLALYRKGEDIKFEGDKYSLPDERYGLVFVFRIFDKVSYALVMQTKLPIQLLDRANTP